jgi:vacuolar-type H+-ATPase subunit I/STV1
LCKEERIFLSEMRLLIIILLGLSLILSLIGIITSQWYTNPSSDFHEGLWISCERISSISHCRKQTYFTSQGLALSGVILLSIAFILSIIYNNRRNDRLLCYLIILILVGSTLLLIFSYLVYPRDIHSRQFGYSLYFMLISSLIVLVTTGLTTFTARTIQSTST